MTDVVFVPPSLYTIESTRLITCSKCAVQKQADAFPKANNRLSGRQAYCKVCHASYARSKSTPERHRHYNLKRKGLTAEQYDAMLQAQGGCCKICKGPPMGKGRFHVDHNHQTGRIRGLLCHKCNVALGMVGDSTERLFALAQYLKAELT